MKAPRLNLVLSAVRLNPHLEFPSHSARKRRFECQYGILGLSRGCCTAWPGIRGVETSSESNWSSSFRSCGWSWAALQAAVADAICFVGEWWGHVWECLMCVVSEWLKLRENQCWIMHHEENSSGVASTVPCCLTAYKTLPKHYGRPAEPKNLRLLTGNIGFNCFGQTNDKIDWMSFGGQGSMRERGKCLQWENQVPSWWLVG